MKIPNLDFKKGDNFKNKFSEVPQEFLQKNPYGRVLRTSSGISPDRQVQEVLNSFFTLKPEPG
jgi:hypothetical protein